MRHRFVRLVLLGPIVGLSLVLAIAHHAIFSVDLVFAQDLPPRPTLTPMPAPEPDSRDDEDERSAPVPLGLITGTVIDRATGAPAPGVAVLVGDTVVVSDANGNYGREGLPAGVYQVALAPEVVPGDPAQLPVMVDLPPGGTVVYHLVFGVAPAPASLAPAELPATGGVAGLPILLILGAGLLSAGCATRWVRRIGM